MFDGVVLARIELVVAVCRQVAPQVHVIGVAAQTFRTEGLDADRAFSDLFHDAFVR